MKKAFTFIFFTFFVGFLLCVLFPGQIEAVVRSRPPMWFALSPSCSITVPSQAKANEWIDIDVSGSSDTFGISTVNFSSDNNLNGSPDGSWDTNGPYDWNVSDPGSPTGAWEATAKIKKWSFSEIGDYEVFAEITNILGQSSSCFDTISIVNQPPTSLISCDASSCPGGACNANWIAFRPTADPNPCIYTINNDSTDLDSANCPDPCNDDIIKSEWYLKKQGEPDSSYLLKSSCGGVCDYTLQTDIVAGDYVVKLYVEDTKGDSDETTHLFTVREEVAAGFICSLDNIEWQACEDLSGLVTEGELVYFKDDPSLAEYSLPSQGAINSRIWAINGTNFDSNNNSNPATNLTAATNIIRLTVTDSANRSDYQEHTILAAPPLPEWKEIPPVLWLKKFLASLFEIIYD